MSKNFVVLISGSGSNLQALIDACESGLIDGRISAVISNKADAYGLVRAETANIPTHTLSHKSFASREEYDVELAKLIESHNPDLVVLAGFMRILTANFVQKFGGKMLNIHPSLLPKYQGLNTHQRALDAGDKVHGVSVHFVTEELDGGPVVCQATIDVTSEDTAETLAQRIHKKEHIIYPLVVDWFCKGKLTMQNGAAWLDHKVLPPTGIQYVEEN